MHYHATFQRNTKKTPAMILGVFPKFGAGNEIRTRDPNLGKVVLYQLSYSRIIGTPAIVMFLPVLSRWKLEYFLLLTFILLISLLISHRIVHARQCGLKIYKHGPHSKDR